jgi:hypothetical protein
VLKSLSDIWQDQQHRSNKEIEAGQDNTPGNKEGLAGRGYSHKRERYQNSQGQGVFDFLALSQQWDKVVGPKLSQHTSPAKIKNSTLYIRVNHSAYSQQLSFFKPQIIEKVIALYPALRGKIKNVQFFVGAAPQASAKPDSNINKKQDKEYKLHKYNPKFQQTKKTAEEFFSDIEDPELKEMLIAIKIQSDLDL